MSARLANEILTALDVQTVTVPGSKAAEIVLPKLTDSLKEVLLQRKTIGEDVERVLDDHPRNDQNLWIPGGRAFPEDDL